MVYQFAIATQDIVDGIRNRRMWGRLGWLEIKRRYRRTVLGPLWAVLSLGIFVVLMGILWSKLWHQDPHDYLPWLCSGILPWTLTTTIILESCSCFITSEGIVKQMPFAYTTFSCSVVWRNLIVFAHNLVIYVGVAAYGGITPNFNTLLVVPGLALNAITGIWFSLLLGTLCARFRDIQQLMGSIIQIAFFVTPVFYSPDQLGENVRPYLNLNVLYHYIDIVRSPLLGKAPAPLSWGITVGFTVAGGILTFLLFARFRRRIAYWL